jgi:hypothetical protein
MVGIIYSFNYNTWDQLIPGLFLRVRNKTNFLWMGRQETYTSSKPT